MTGSTRFQVVEHIADVGECLHAIIKLLKPGGSLAFSVPNNSSFIQWDEENILNMPPHHMGRWRPEVVEHLKNHFKIDSTEVLLSPLEAIHAPWYVYLRMKQVFPIWPIPGIAAQTFGRLLKMFPAVRQKIAGHSILAVLKNSIMNQLAVYYDRKRFRRVVAVCSAVFRKPFAQMSHRA